MPAFPSAISRTNADIRHSQLVAVSNVWTHARVSRSIEQERYVKVYQVWVGLTMPRNLHATYSKVSLTTAVRHH